MDKIESLASRGKTVSPEVTCGEVYELFSSDEDLLAIAVVENDIPVGLVNRNDLTLRLADRFGRPLYENKPIKRLMDPAPLIVEAEHSIDFLSRFILDERPSALMEGFIVTRRGRYFGIGTAMTLLQANMMRLKARTDELERAKIHAESANRSKSMFLANMSHELRTPLNAIIGFTDLMAAETLGPITPREYAAYIRDVNESGKHLLNVINAILDMSKVEANRLELHEDYVDPEEIVLSAARMMRATAERKGISLHLDIAPDLPDLYADKQLLRQILLNLLSNAIKFSGDSQEIEISVGLTANGDMLFSVIDHGIGIAAEDMERVFEPFGQVESSFTRCNEGTGLGLPLCKALVEVHGGSITLDSTPGVGTRVDVLLPANRVLHIPNDRLAQV
ncbi:MAG: hypothetical protein Kow00104_07440 [Rhodothalassiaceae bacterium]